MASTESPQHGGGAGSERRDLQRLTAELLELFPSGEELASGARDPGREHHLREALERLVSDDFVTEMIADEGFRAERRGVEGFLDAWNDWLEAFESFRLEMEEVRELEQAVLTLVVLRGVPRGGRSEIESPAAAVWFLADGRLVRVEFHLDRQTALRHAEAGQPSA